MIYTEHDLLSVIELKDEADTVSFDMLAKEISAKPSNTVYCERKGKLCGIISMGDIARADKENAAYVTVNKKFTWIRPKEYMKARNIFREKTNINALPVVNEKQELMGAYARLPDICVKETISFLALANVWFWYALVVCIRINGKCPGFFAIICHLWDSTLKR